MRLREALVHPTGVILLMASVVLAVLPRMAPALAPWPDLSTWLVLSGLLAYLTIVVVVTRTRPASPYVAVRQLMEIRRSMVDRLSDLERGSSGNAALTAIVAEAVQHLDEEILPRLEELEARHRALGRQMERYRAKGLRPPSGSTMSRLRDIQALQKQAIDCCIQQAADAEAILLALAHETDDARTVKRAQAWVDELQGLHERLSEVLGGRDGAGRAAWDG